LEGFGFERCPVELIDPAGEGDARLGPARLHEPDPFREASDEVGWIHLEGGEHSSSSSDAQTDLEAPATELIERTDSFGEVDGIVQGADEDGTAQPQSLGTRGGERHQFERGHERGRAQHRFLCPGAVKAEGLRSAQIGAQCGRVEGAVGYVLGDRNGKVHSSLLQSDMLRPEAERE